MERATQERLVGAVILVLAVVAIVPTVLTGPQSPPEAAPRETAMKSLEIQLAPAPRAADERVPEPVAPAPRPGSGTEAGGIPPAPTGLPPAEAPASRPAVAESRSAPGPAAPAAQPAAAPRAAAAPDPNAAWAVQLGAFSSRPAADKLIADLRRRGYPAFLVEYRGEGRVLHRVRVGPEQDRDRADALAARLAKDGFKGNVARHP